jgi:hypothetical protein
MNQAAPFSGEYSGVISTLTIVPLKTGAAANSARAVVDQFMAAVIQNNTQQAVTFLAPALRQRVPNNVPFLSSLLGVESVSQPLKSLNQATYTLGRQAPRAVIKGYMQVYQPSPVEFELSSSGAGGAWLIDQVIPLQ